VDSKTLRVSDADRDAVLTELGRHFQAGRLDPAELDDVYASRILLETLALSMTIGHFGTKARAEAKRMLTTMRRAAKTGDFDAWFGAHTDYHRVCTAAAGEVRRVRTILFVSVWAPVLTLGAQCARTPNYGEFLRHPYR